MNLIDMPHYHDPKRPYMSMHDRAGQFMPFKSLKDYHEMVSESEEELSGGFGEEIIYDEIDEF